MKKIVTILGIVLIVATSNLVARTAATVNGIKITVKEANLALKEVTQGKMSSWMLLPENAQRQLVQMMAPSKLVAHASKQGLTSKEKEAALASFWMQKKISETKISDKKAKSRYNQLKKGAKKGQKIVSFNKIKNNLKAQMAQEAVVKKLMRNVKIRIK